MSKLRVFFPDGNTRDYQLPPMHGQTFLIGRAQGANLQFERKNEFDFVSDQHAYITNQNGRYFISDGAPGGSPSVVGTFVNGNPIGNYPHPLNPGDEISLGSSNFGVRMQLVAEQPQQAYMPQQPPPYYGQPQPPMGGYGAYPLPGYSAIGPMINGVQYEYADFGTRLVAYIIDAVILAIIGAVVGFFVGAMFGPNPNDYTWYYEYNDALARTQLLSTGVGLIINALYFIYFLTNKDGQTPGKSAMNIKIVKSNGAPLTAGDAFLRNIVGYFISGIVILLGFIWAAFDQQKQGWHDKLANTYVVRVPRQYYAPPPGGYNQPPRY